MVYGVFARSIAAFLGHWGRDLVPRDLRVSMLTSALLFTNCTVRDKKAWLSEAIRVSGKLLETNDLAQYGE
jgi:hypothetical protein